VPKFQSVPVPEDLVEEVYRFIACRRTDPSKDGPSIPDAATSPEKVPTAWNEQLLRELLETSSSSATKSIVFAVAQKPGERIPTPALAADAGLKGGRGMGGWVARVTKLCESNWGLPLPIDSEWDEDAGHYLWTMDPDLARIVRSIE